MTMHRLSWWGLAVILAAGATFFMYLLAAFLLPALIWIGLAGALLMLAGVVAESLGRARDEAPEEDEPVAAEMKRAA